MNERGIGWQDKSCLFSLLKVVHHGTLNGYKQVAAIVTTLEGAPGGPSAP